MDSKRDTLSALRALLCVPSRINRWRVVMAPRNKVTDSAAMCCNQAEQDHPRGARSRCARCGCDFAGTASNDTRRGIWMTGIQTTRCT